MEVVAPATLMEGYELEIHVPERFVTVIVPSGGVKKGQKFMAPAKIEKNPGRSHIPIGDWKDGLCNCFRHGLCHASCWISYCCPAMAAGQVINRLGLNWLGYPTEMKSERACAFQTLCIISLVTFVIGLSLSFVRIIYFVFSFLVIMNLR